MPITGPAAIGAPPCYRIMKCDLCVCWPAVFWRGASGGANSRFWDWFWAGLGWLLSRGEGDVDISGDGDGDLGERVRTGHGGCGLCSQESRDEDFFFQFCIMKASTILPQQQPHQQFTDHCF
jgi:hypothetical protein